VADHVTVLLGDKFEDGVAVGAQLGHQIGLVGLTEGGGDHLRDGGVVGGAGDADHPPFYGQSGVAP